jgi:hypothetical protein
MDGLTQHATRFVSFAKKLRCDAVLAKEVIGRDLDDPDATSRATISEETARQ